MSDDDEGESKMISNINSRERAFSESIKTGRKGHRSDSSMTLQHIVYKSDSDLSHIDREKTFAFDTQRSSVGPGELLAKVVVALGGYRLGDEDEQRQPSIYGSAMGIHGFSDSQILASEQNYQSSNWSITPSERSFGSKRAVRSRATSEVRIPIEESVKVFLWFLQWC